MSAQDYYGGSRQNTHTPGGSSSRHLSAGPLIDGAGYRPRSANSERPRSSFSSLGLPGSGSSHHRSRSSGPPGYDAQLGTGQEGERGLVSTIGGGAAGGYAGKKFLGGKLGAVAGALGGAVVANKLEHRLSGTAVIMDTMDITDTTTRLLLLPRRPITTEVTTTTTTTTADLPRHPTEVTITARRTMAPRTTAEAITPPVGSAVWSVR
ncbi:hypothetical protein COL516b_002908 [Colletotrichum fioriniae]|nr:uncharacterized protein COL516b_002908 [Colletotrichum fioriniae]KAJ0309657.1 hypothetical protein COL516b_002908 [Colletotrichum fioriniae]